MRLSQISRGESTLTLAAASSIASGTPCRSRHRTGDGRRVVRCQLEVGPCRGGAIDEQADGLVVRDDFWRGSGRLVGEVERWDNDHVLPAEPERPSAGEQEPDVRAGRPQSLHEVAHGGEKVFAVVEHQQRVAVGDVVGERVDLPRPVGALQVEGLRDGGAHQLGRGEVLERHHPAAVAERASRLLGDPEGDPGLPDPAVSHEGDDPRRPQVLANVGQQCSAAHERRVRGEGLDEATIVLGPRLALNRSVSFLRTGCSGGRRSPRGRGASRSR